MDYRKKMLAVFNGKKIDKILFAPEMVRWYRWHRNVGTLPSEYRNTKFVDIYDDLDIGMLPIFYCSRYQDGEDTKITERNMGNIRQTIIETPVGKVCMEDKLKQKYEFHTGQQKSLLREWKTLRR